MAIIFAILMFSLLIFVHELGHFVTAKLSGVQVNEFALFMGPTLWKKQIGETLYSIHLIPFGGYCAMEGEDEDTDNPRSFQRAAWWKRLIILVAGSAMNFITAIVIFAILYLPSTHVSVPVITQFMDCCTFNTEDGLQLGDEIVEIDGYSVDMNADVSLLLSVNPTVEHDITVVRDGEVLVFEDLSMGHTHVNEEGQTYLHYGFGFGEAKKADFGDRVGLVWDVTKYNVRSVWLSLDMLISGKAGLMDLSGPVGIVSVMSDTVDNSASGMDAFLNLLYFSGMISVNLAIMNMLPIPALDGGRVVGLLITTLIEKVTKKKVNPKIEGYLHGITMILLLALMAIIMFKDIFVIFKR